MTNLKNILARIEQRLTATEQSATAASKAAGKPDAIRNIQRAVEEDSDGSIKLDTLLALAEQLKADPQWLIFGGDQETAVSDTDLKPYLDAFHSVLMMMVDDQEEADALLKIAILAAEEPPVPSSGPHHHRVLAELGVRKFLKSKQSRHDGA